MTRFAAGLLVTSVPASPTDGYFPTDDHTTGVPTRRTVLTAAVGTFAALVAVARIGLWRLLPIEDPVELLVENRDDEAHDVLVRVEDGERTVYEERVHVPAGTPTEGWASPGRTTREGILRRVGRYRVVAELDDGTTDEYGLEPLDTPIWGTNMPIVVVSIDGELGRFAVLGGGGKP